MPRSVPIADYIPGWFERVEGEDPEAVWLGTIDGDSAWTDGRVMVKGPIPASCDVSTETRSFENPLAKARREGLKPISPVAVAELGMYDCVVFSDGHDHSSEILRCHSRPIPICGLDGRRPGKSAHNPE